MRSIRPQQKKVEESQESQGSIEGTSKYLLKTQEEKALDAIEKLTVLLANFASDKTMQTRASNFHAVLQRCKEIIAEFNNPAYIHHEEKLQVLRELKQSQLTDPEHLQINMLRIRENAFADVSYAQQRMVAINKDYEESLKKSAQEYSAILQTTYQEREKQLGDLEKKTALFTKKIEAEKTALKGAADDLFAKMDEVNGVLSLPEGKGKKPGLEHLYAVLIEKYETLDKRYKTLFENRKQFIELQRRLIDAPVTWIADFEQNHPDLGLPSFETQMVEGNAILQECLWKLNTLLSDTKQKIQSYQSNLKQAEGDMTALANHINHRNRCYKVLQELFEQFKSCDLQGVNENFKNELINLRFALSGLLALQAVNQKQQPLLIEDYALSNSRKVRIDLAQKEQEISELIDKEIPACAKGDSAFFSGELRAARADTLSDIQQRLKIFTELKNKFLLVKTIEELFPVTELEKIQLADKETTIEALQRGAERLLRALRYQVDRIREAREAEEIAAELEINMIKENLELLFAQKDLVKSDLKTKFAALNRDFALAKKHEANASMIYLKRYKEIENQVHTLSTVISCAESSQVNTYSKSSQPAKSALESQRKQSGTQAVPVKEERINAADISPIHLRKATASVQSQSSVSTLTRPGFFRRHAGKIGGTFGGMLFGAVAGFFLAPLTGGMSIPLLILLGCIGGGALGGGVGAGVDYCCRPSGSLQDKISPTKASKAKPRNTNPTPTSTNPQAASTGQIMTELALLERDMAQVDQDVEEIQRALGNQSELQSAPLANEKLTASQLRQQQVNEFSERLLKILASFTSLDLIAFSSKSLEEQVKAIEESQTKDLSNLIHRNIDTLWEQYALTIEDFVGSPLKSWMDDYAHHLCEDHRTFISCSPGR